MTSSWNDMTTTDPITTGAVETKSKQKETPGWELVISAHEARELTDITQSVHSECLVPLLNAWSEAIERAAETGKNAICESALALAKAQSTIVRTAARIHLELKGFRVRFIGNGDYEVQW